MKKTVIFTLSLLLVVSAASFIVPAETQNNEDGEVVERSEFQAPSVQDNEDVDVKWTVDPRRPWLIFEITGGNNIGFDEIKTAGTYKANGVTTYKVRTNWQGELKVQSAVEGNNFDMATLYVDEKVKTQIGGSTYTYTWDRGYIPLDTGWKTLAKYRHDGEWVDYENRTNNVKLKGKFKYKLEVPTGTDAGDYHAEVIYRASAL